MDSFDLLRNDLKIVPNHDVTSLKIHAVSLAQSRESFQSDSIRQSAKLL